MMLAAIMYLTPGACRLLLGEISSRLTPDGSALIEVIQPWTAPVPRQQFVSVRSGQHGLEGEMEASPFAGNGLDRTTTYRRVDTDGAALDETINSVRCWVVDPDRFGSEASVAGLSVELHIDELALLRRRQ